MIELSRDDLADCLDQAELRIVELEAALRPFAEVAKHDIGDDEADDDLFRPISEERFARAKRLTVGDLRRAKAARYPVKRNADV